MAAPSAVVSNDDRGPACQAQRAAAAMNRANGNRPVQGQRITVNRHASAVAMKESLFRLTKFRASRMRELPCLSACEGKGGADFLTGYFRSGFPARADGVSGPISDGLDLFGPITLPNHIA